MKHSLTITSAAVAARACAIIQGLPMDEVHEVVIRPWKQDRSEAQNRLLWVFLTTIGNELGETKDAMHERYKERFLVPIFERDDAEYAAMIEAVRQVHRAGMKAEAKAMKKQIISLTSTTRANVAQMAEYLNDIERDAESMAIRLQHPEDIYHEAMGRAA